MQQNQFSVKSKHSLSECITRRSVLTRTATAAACCNFPCTTTSTVVSYFQALSCLFSCCNDYPPISRSCIGTKTHENPFPLLFHEHKFWSSSESWTKIFVTVAEP
ncbi:hypothetical protein QL285_009178 [Trifolium repens]|nr:hypothetical protein QL285_009178 [Trifolium repens]